MSHHSVSAVVLSLLCASLASAPVFGQAPPRTEADPTWVLPRTPDGHPELQGFWTTQTFTPLERPEHLADQEFYTEEQAAELQQQLTVAGADPLARSVINLDDPAEIERQLQQTHRDETYVHYDNAVWLRTPVPKGLTSRRTSLITAPPNGRIPARTAEADARAAARGEARRGREPFDGHELRPLSERCMVWPHNGPPMLPPAYNDIHQIFQTSDHVVVFTELNNNLPRIIPMDGRPPISDRIRLFPGDSRGRWEGDTLVVETTHFTDRTRFQGSSERLHVVERFTRISADRLIYEFTVDDPATWDTPWSAEIPMVKTEGPMFEFACHEGNYDIRHILEGYRNLEAQAAGETVHQGSK